MKIHNWRAGVGKHKSTQQKTANPLRAGAISAAAINWTAFFDPIDTHPDIVLAGVAARSLAKAEAQIAHYNLKDVKAYGSYEELLADPNIDVVYTALPNGLHAEWAIKAMEAGKHILVEKPIASNASDVEKIKQCSIRTGKVVLEAMHWQFHPVAHAVREEIESGKHGKILSFRARMTLPRGTLSADDIRLKYDLSGGATMDLSYVLSAASYFCGLDSTTSIDIQKAVPRLSPGDPKIDEAMDVEFVLTDHETGVEAFCTTHGDLLEPKLLGIVPRYWNMMPSCAIELEKSQISLDNFVGPHMSHSIDITEKDSKGNATGKKRSLHFYKGGPKWGDRGEAWWTTYRYQLEAFVEMVRNVQQGKNHTMPPCWLSLDESQLVMSVIDAVYENAGLPKRESRGLVA